MTMDKRNGMLMCSAAALLAFAGTGQARAAAPAGPPPAPRSYADLLEPISNPVEVLKADSAAPQAEPKLQVAQYHHHHHHHHYYHHHHHHHHHHGWYGGRWYGGGFYGPCYWTLGAPVWNGYRWVRQRVRVCE